MQKLIVIYTIDDDCTWSSDIIECFEHESCEAFLVDFEKALLKGIELSDLFSDKEQKFYDKLGSYSEKEIQNYYAWRNDFLEKNPGSESHEFTFCGHRFRIYDFRYWSESKNKYYIELPDVMLLDEWFSSKVKGHES